MSRGPVNLQDGFLNQARREGTRLTITMISGSTFEGKIEAFDNFTVVVNASGKHYLIYKHAISSMGPLSYEPRRQRSERSANHRKEAGRGAGADKPKPAPAPAAPSGRASEPFNPTLQQGLAALADERKAEGE